MRRFISRSAGWGFVLVLLSLTLSGCFQPVGAALEATPTTNVAILPTALPTALPTQTPELSPTPFPPTVVPASNTPEPPTEAPTQTPLPTETFSGVALVPSETPVPATNTPTYTPTTPTLRVAATSTETPTAMPTETPTETPTDTPVPPTATPTETPAPPTETPTITPTVPTATPTLFIPTLAPAAVAQEPTGIFPTSDVQATLNAQATEIIAIVTATAAANATGTATVQGTFPAPGAEQPTPIPGLPTVPIVPGVATQPPGTPGLPGSGAAGPIDANCRYTVVAGDRLLRIVLRFNSSLSLIARVNGIVNQDLLTPGQVLRIPDCGVATEAPTPVPTLTEMAQPGPNVTVIVVTATPEAGGRVYVVQEGDTLFRIANRFGVRVSTLAQANGITNMNLIYIGQRLVIP